MEISGALSKGWGWLSEIQNMWQSAFIWGDTAFKFSYLFIYLFFISCKLLLSFKKFSSHLFHIKLQACLQAHDATFQMRICPLIENADLCWGGRIMANMKNMPCICHPLCDDFATQFLPNALHSIFVVQSWSVNGSWHVSIQSLWCQYVP